MINFDLFTKENKAVVPVHNKKCRYNRKYYDVDTDDGWYLCSFIGNEAKALEVADPTISVLEDCRIIYGYKYNNQVVLQNFDMGRIYLKGKIIVPYYFGDNICPFTSIKVAAWPDGNFYFYSIDYSDLKIFDVWDAFTYRRDLSTVKGVTPELKALFNFYIVERAASEKAIEDAQRRAKALEYIDTLEGKLVQAFNTSGATIISYKSDANKGVVEVNWTYDGSDYVFNSILDSNTLQVLEAGYCLSGHDKEHTAISIVKLAKSYEEDDLIHITRR